MVVSEEWRLQRPQSWGPSLHPIPQLLAVKHRDCSAKEKGNSGADGGQRRALPAGFRQLKGYREAVPRAEGRGGC